MVCPSPAACVAAFSVHYRLVVLGESAGTWTREAAPPGVSFRSLACASVGSCVVAGMSSGGAPPPVVVTQSGRSWRSSVVQLPGTPNPSGATDLSSVSCGSAGNCTTVGGYSTHGQGSENHALLVRQNSGSWGAGFDAQLPFGAATKSDANGDPAGGVASVVSCPSAGNCAAGGTYAVPVAGHWPGGFLNRPDGWVATERAGHWGPGSGVQLPGDKTALGPFFGFTGLSCASAGNCTAVGGYDGGHGPQGLIVTERDGVWLPGIKAPLPPGGVAPSDPNEWVDPLYSASCAAPDDCAAIGAYVQRGSPHLYRGWLLTERRGKWSGSALVLPSGVTATGDVNLTSVSCPSRGNCVAVAEDGLIVIERGGKWQRAIEAARPANANGTAALDSVSCSSTSRCTAVGSYDDRSGKARGLILSLRLR